MATVTTPSSGPGGWTSGITIGSRRYETQMEFEMTFTGPFAGFMYYQHTRVNPLFTWYFGKFYTWKQIGTFSPTKNLTFHASRSCLNPKSCTSRVHLNYFSKLRNTCNKKGGKGNNTTDLDIRCKRISVATAAVTFAKTLPTLDFHPATNEHVHENQNDFELNSRYVSSCTMTGTK